MLLDHNSHQSFAETLPTEERDLYWQLIGHIETLPADDEMRRFVDVLAIYARTALRAATSSTERIEAATQKISAMLMEVFARQEKLEKLFAAQTEKFNEAHKQSSSDQRTVIPTRNILATVQDELAFFLKTLPVGGPQTAETELVRKAVGQIDVLSKHFRKLVVNTVPEIQNLSKRITLIVQQAESLPNRSSPLSRWERCWPVLIGMAILLVGIGSAFWAGRHTAGH